MALSGNPVVLGGGAGMPSGASTNVGSNGTSTDNAVARFDGTTGSLIQNSVVTIADTTGAIAGAQSLTGGAANFTLLAGTGASRTLIFQTTTSGSVATTALTLNADQTSTFAKNIFVADSIAPTAATSGAGIYGSASAGLFVVRSGSTANQRIMDITATGDGVWKLRTVNDAYASALDMLIFTVTGGGGAVSSAFGGSVATSAPVGGAGAWELGIANAVSPTSPNRTITVEIGGTAYYIHAKTTND